MDDLRDGQHFLLLKLPCYHLYPNWCTITDLWVIYSVISIVIQSLFFGGGGSGGQLTCFPVLLVWPAEGLVVRIKGVNTFISLCDGYNGDAVVQKIDGLGLGCP